MRLKGPGKTGEKTLQEGAGLDLGDNLLVLGLGILVNDVGEGAYGNAAVVEVALDNLVA